MTLFLRIAAGLAALTVVLATPYAAHSYPQGAPSGTAGNNAFTCASGGCHDSFELNSGTGSVTIDAPATVQPGETVTITVSVDNTTPPAPGAERQQGFEASVRDQAGGSGVGVGDITITDPDHTRVPFDGDASYVTHSSGGLGETSWSFDWTAPTDAATATIFAAGNAANGGDGSLGDYIYTTTRSIAVLVDAEDGPDARGFSLDAPYPNPARGVSTTAVTLAAPATVTARIVDGRGRTVREIATAERRAGAHDLALDVRGLAAGTYFVVVEADGARRTQPLVVAR